MADVEEPERGKGEAHRAILGRTASVEWEAPLRLAATERIGRLNHHGQLGETRDLPATSRVHCGAEAPETVANRLNQPVARRRGACVCTN